ncbi:MAG: hypothetical protein IKJ36_01025 [Clostridia bacterium]|nr:hypothetical protein [Clostridia bacterium]
MDLLKEMMPYIVSIMTAIISGLCSYNASKKQFNHELDVIKTNNKHDINKLMEQHKIDIDNLKEKHKLEMEIKEKEYQHEKEMIALKSKVLMDEKNQDVMNNAMSGILENIFNDIITGKMTAKDLENISKQFPSQDKK